ncbi:MAG TPA: ABC transporter permease [Bryobacteraceae bacterium]|nr:ABC transporter permease [Bryobacteraceae bacterium]
MTWRRRNHDLDDEIRAHLSMAVQDRVSRGESPDDALRSARRELGNETLTKEITREMWGWAAVERFRQDLHYAFRQMRRSPGFSAMAILSLAIGLGAATAMFSIVNGVLLQPLAFRDPARLYVARTAPPPEAHLTRDFPINARHFSEWRAHCQACESVSLIQMDDLTLSGSGEPVKLPALRVSFHFFDSLGLRPAIGRDFLWAEESGLGQVILSDSLWRARFAADPGILGRSIQLNGEPHTVIGVLPRHLVLPRGDQWGGYFGPADEPLIFEPLGFHAEDQKAAGSLNYTAVIRLKPNVSPQHAIAELNALLADFVREYHLPTKITLFPLLEQVTRRARTALWLLLGAVGAVLLIVCVNIGNLMLVRAASRSREAGIRLALGARRIRLFGQALKEALVLVAIGGSFGLLLSDAALRAFTAAAPIDLPRLEEVHMDWRVVLFALAAMAFSAIACGLAPAWRLSRVAPLDSMKAASAGQTEAGRKLRFRELLVSLEVALSTVLLIAGSLLLVSFVRLTSVDKGFETAHVITQDVSFLSPKYSHGGRDRAIRLMLERLSAIPGVRAVGATSRLPLRGEDWVSDLSDSDAASQADAIANFRFVTPGYWQAIGIQLQQGRLFNDADWSRPVAVISSKAARHLWPGGNPIGRHVTGIGPAKPALEVVGVVGEVPAGPVDQNWPMMVYEPYALITPVAVSFVIRTAGDPAALIASVRTTLSAVDAEMALPPARTMDQIMDASVAARRFEMRLIMAFALIALLLAALGVYGVISFTVARRTQEIGIRVAMGARPSQVTSMILRQGITPVLTGLAAGLAVALLAGRFLTAELYDIKSNDPLSISAVAAALLLTALVACWAPARRATHGDPLLALRSD